MGKPEHAALALTGFSLRRPRYEIGQAQSLDWLAAVHAASDAQQHQLSIAEQVSFEGRLRKIMERCACGPDKIAKRGHAIADVGSHDFSEAAIYDVANQPRGKGTAARFQVFDEVVSDYFATEYAAIDSAPSDLIHVTCTGYRSPSGAQKLVANKRWGAQTRVTHAYHMGCYAAFPALRMAAGFLSAPGSLAQRADSSARVDIVHTELCSLHLDPSDHSIEQLVVQSLFADGLIRYSMTASSAAPRLEALAVAEMLVPDSADAMSWTVADAGMHMTLDRSVPERIASSLRAFVTQLYRKAGLDVRHDLASSVLAVHPGGPRIIDAVQRVLEVSSAQVATSRAVLSDFGNMSSATLPHIWMRLLDDEQLAAGTHVLSLAFGPGLTLCGGLFRKQ